MRLVERKDKTINFKVGSKIVNKFTKEVLEITSIETMGTFTVYVLRYARSEKIVRLNSSYLNCYNLLVENK